MIDGYTILAVALLVAAIWWGARRERLRRLRDAECWLAEAPPERRAKLYDHLKEAGWL